TISAYKPSQELGLLLQRGDLEQFWPQAWSGVVGLSNIPKLAFERSAHEIAEATNALARAVVAELHVVATSHGKPGPSRVLRQKLIARLLDDWHQQVYAISTFFAKLFKRAATRLLSNHRRKLSDMASLFVGDILLYQARGAEV